MKGKKKKHIFFFTRKDLVDEKERWRSKKRQRWVIEVAKALEGFVIYLQSSSDL